MSLVAESASGRCWTRPVAKWRATGEKPSPVTVWTPDQTGRQVETSDPKTDSGYRVVALDDDTVDVLRRHRERQEADRAEWGSAWVDVKIVSDTLGHSDTRITRDIYQSVLLHVGKSAAEATAELVPLQRKADAEEARKTAKKAKSKGKKKRKRKRSYGDRGCRE